MAKGDYGPGTRLEPIRIEIEVDPQTLKISHCGIGYHIQLLSGKVHQSGYTWHSPQGQYAMAPPEHVADLQRVVDALLKAAADHEGIGLPGQRQSPTLEPHDPVDDPNADQES